MYFNAETQAQHRCGRFHFALSDAGVPVPRQGRDAAQPLRSCSSPSTCASACSARRRRRSDRTPRPPASWSDTAGRERGARPAAKARPLASGPAAQLVVDLGGQARGWPTRRLRALFGLRPARPRAALPGSGRLLPAGRAAVRIDQALAKELRRSSCTTWNGRGRAAARPVPTTSRSCRCSRRRGDLIGVGVSLHRRDAVPPAPGRARVRQPQLERRLRGAAVH